MTPDYRLSADVPDADCRRDVSFLATGPYNGLVEQSVTFAASTRYLQEALENPHVAGVIVPDDLAAVALDSGKGVAVHPAPRDIFFDLHNRLAAQRLGELPPARIHPDAIISPAAHIDVGATIEAGATIGPLAYVGPGSHIGAGVLVGEGALVGVSGHFESWRAGSRRAIAHLGYIEVGANAQILAGAILQRDVYNVKTSIGENAVVGPGVQMAHGTHLGAGSVITGGSVVAGFTRIGRDVWIGPGSVIGNNLRIDDGAKIEIGSVVVRSVAARDRVSGNFAIPHLANIRNWARNARG